MISLPSRLRSVLFAILVSFTCMLPTAGAANWYVDSAATSGSRSGASWANAWLTLSAISWSSLTGGDIVWVRGGPYVERLTIGKSGASRTARIMLKGVGLPIISGGIDGGTQSNIAVIGFEITQTSANTYAAIRLAGGNGWLIQDNYVHDTYGTGVDLIYNTVNSFNIIRNNRMSNICGVSAGASSGQVFQIYGDSNLIEYNTIALSLDRNRAFGAGNVIRNNYFGATDALPYTATSPYPHHTDAFQSYESTRVLSKLLFERNYDIDNKDSVAGTNAHHFIIQDGNNSGINWIISRFNVAVRPGGVGFQLQNFTRFYVYNMTMITLQNALVSLYGNGVAYDAPPAGGAGMNIQDFRNITWSYSPHILDPGGIISTSNRGSNFTSDYQHTYNASGLTLPKLFAAPNNLAANLDPLFTNLATDDYTLQASSPLRNKGGPMTNATNAGANSTSLTVADSKRIFDGWGIADADWIRIGSGALVRIASIDYNSDTVTLTAARSWNSGDAVYVKGSEDIGALPYAYAKRFTVTNTSPALVLGQNTLSASVDNPDAVRMVEFLVDGVPAGIAYDAPYTVNYTSDGATHTVTARAYAAWAASTLTSENSASGPPVAPSSAQVIISTP